MMEFRKLSLLVVTVITAIYLLVLYALFSPFSEVIEFLKSAPFNERGDLLAGLFGPLAVVWIVFGFFMQSHELKLQREEISRQANRDNVTHAIEMRRSDPRVHIETNSARNMLKVHFLDNNFATQLAVHVNDIYSGEGKIVGIIQRTSEGIVWEISLDEWGISLNAKRHKIWISYYSLSNGQRVQEFEILGTGENLAIMQNGVVYTPA